MKLDKEIFSKSKIDFKSLVPYGFEEMKDGTFSFSKQILDGEFILKVDITKQGTITCKVIEVAFNEEFLGMDVEDYVGGFIGDMKDECTKVLQDIKEKCCYEELFRYPQTLRIVNAIKDTFNDNPEFLWEDDDSGVFRNKKSNKWYGIIMHINKAKLCDENKDIEVMNIKLDPKEIDELVKEKGFFRAYHMNKKYWITISLDDSVEDERILELIKKSYVLVS